MKQQKQPQYKMSIVCKGMHQSVVGYKRLANVSGDINDVFSDLRAMGFANEEISNDVLDFFGLTANWSIDEASRLSCLGHYQALYHKRNHYDLFKKM